MRIDATHPLVLGSASPRRRELLSLLGVAFVVQPADADETPRDDEPAGAYLDRVADAKLAAALPRAPEAAAGVLVADTIVVAPDGRVLGKPRDEDDACAMVTRLSGATHEVRTRFLLAEPRAPRAAHAQTVTTRVTFRALTEQEAREYAASGEGRDKAGGYAVQGRAAAFVARIDGSYASVVGLPVCELAVALRSLGWI